MYVLTDRECLFEDVFGQDEFGTVRLLWMDETVLMLLYMFSNIYYYITFFSVYAIFLHKNTLGNL